MLSSFKKVSFLRQAMQLIFLEVSLTLGLQSHCRSGCKHSVFLFQGKRRSPDAGTYSCCAEQGPCCAPGAVCRGRDSAACQAQHSACPGSCPGRCGETCGGKEPPGRAGQGPSAATAAAWGSGSQIPCSTGCFQRHFARIETRQRFSFSYS